MKWPWEWQLDWFVEIRERITKNHNDAYAHSQTLHEEASRHRSSVEKAMHERIEGLRQEMHAQRGSQYILLNERVTKQLDELKSLILQTHERVNDAMREADAAHDSLFDAITRVEEIVTKQKARRNR